MRVIVMLIAVAIATASGAWAEAGAKNVEKKLIEYGWDVPFPDFVVGHIREMEQRPFDGLVFKLRGGGNVLEPTAWDEAKFAQDYATVPTIQWQKFTDNFVIMWAASDQDWFNDAHWEAIQHNVRLVSKAARLAHCVGVCFDAEPYGKNPWAYNEAVHKDTKSFAEYEGQVRKRGAQFQKAVEAELPNPTVLTFFLLSLFRDQCRPMAVERRQQHLAGDGYGLLPAFLEGMLEGAGAGATFVDGNENAYYYTEKAPYFETYQSVMEGARNMLDPALWAAYRAKVQPGHALYIDQYYGLRATTKTEGNFMKRDDQAKWCEHNAYYALFSTDRYVWCYSERMNWWTGADVPAGCENALRNARAKVAGGEPLGYDVKAVMDAAKEQQKAADRSEKEKAAKEGASGSGK